MCRFRLCLCLKLFLITAAATAAAQAVRELPAPTGSYALGTRYLSFTDRRRDELFTDDRSDYREITVQIWYPAKPYKSGKSAPYLPVDQSVLTRYNFPPDLARIKTHGKMNAPFADEQPSYPVLIYNHGWGEYPGQNTILLEDLVSQGYVVLSLAHHYEALFSYPFEGEAVAINTLSPRWRQMQDEQRTPAAYDLLERLRAAHTFPMQEELCREATSLLPGLYLETPRYWAQDISFLITELERLNRSDPFFKGKFDLGKIGVFGLSMGGLASAHACLIDTRIKAGLTLDGGVFGDLLTQKVKQPYLFLNGDRYRDFEDFFLSCLQGAGYAVSIVGAKHLDFQDLTLLNSSQRLVEGGTIDPQECLKIMSQYVRAFFDQCLVEKDSKLLKGNSQEFPEVDIRVKQGRD